MTTRGLSWILISGFGVFGLGAPYVFAQGQDGTAQADDKTADLASSTGGRVAERVGQQSGRAADDASLAIDVKSQLADRAPGAAEIQVDANNGVVTLSGTVDSHADELRAMSLAWHTKGVRRVDDCLQIRPPH